MLIFFTIACIFVEKLGFHKHSPEFCQVFLHIVLFAKFIILKQHIKNSIPLLQENPIIPLFPYRSHYFILKYCVNYYFWRNKIDIYYWDVVKDFACRTWNIYSFYRSFISTYRNISINYKLWRKNMCSIFDWCYTI